MDEMILEPYAVVQTWHIPGANEQWEAILGEYLQTIAQQCISVGKCVIGHIKALSTFSDKSYLRISVVAANIPATVEGKAPVGCVDLELTLNVLVYGLAQSTIEQIAHETANKIAHQRKGAVHHKDKSQAGEHLHHSHHHNRSKGETP